MDLDAPSHLNIAYLSVIGYDQLKEDNSIRTDNISIYKKQTLINPNVPLYLMKVYEDTHFTSCSYMNRARNDFVPLADNGIQRYTHIALEKHICQLCSQKVQPEEHSASH